jgi:hypothetical protein
MTRVGHGQPLSGKPKALRVNTTASTARIGAVRQAKEETGLVEVELVNFAAAAGSKEAA